MKVKTPVTHIGVWTKVYPGKFLRLGVLNIIEKVSGVLWERSQLGDPKTVTKINDLPEDLSRLKSDT